MACSRREVGKLASKPAKPIKRYAIGKFLRLGVEALLAAGLRKGNQGSVLPSQRGVHLLKGIRRFDTVERESGEPASTRNASRKNSAGTEPQRLRPSLRHVLDRKSRAIAKTTLSTANPTTSREASDIESPERNTSPKTSTIVMIKATLPIAVRLVSAFARFGLGPSSSPAPVLRFVRALSRQT